MESNNEDYVLKKRTFAGLLWRFGERFLAQIVTFIVSIVLARLLLPEDYGIVAIVTVFISLADVLVTNGLGTALIQKNEADDTDFSTILYSGIILSVLLYLCIFFFAPLLSKLYNNTLITIVLRIMGLRIPIAAINSVQQAFVVRNMLFKKFFFSTLIGTVVSGIVGIAMAYCGCGVWSLVGQYLTNTLIDTLVLFFSISWKPKLLFSFSRFKILFSYGWKVMASSFIGVLFNKAKNLVIGAKYSESDLAYYTKGESFPLLISSNVESSIESVVFSALSKQQSDLNKVKNTCSKFLSLGSFIIVPMMIGLAVTSEGIIRLLLTDKWLGCVPFMQVVCLGQIFSIISTVNLQAYKAIGRSDIVLKLEFIKKPILLGIIIGTMFIDPMAIAIGVACYEVIGAFINSMLSRKLINYSLLEQLKDILLTLIISIVMGCIVYFMKFIPAHYSIVLGLQIVLGIISYVILSLLFNKKNSKILIKLIFKRKANVNDVTPKVQKETKPINIETKVDDNYLDNKNK